MYTWKLNTCDIRMKDMITIPITSRNSCVMIGVISVTHMAACPYSRRSWATTSQNRQPICPSQMSMSIPNCYRSQRFILPTALGRSAPTHNRQVPRRRNNEARSPLLAQTSLSTHQRQKDTYDGPMKSKKWGRTRNRTRDLAHTQRVC
jgi:hypothetical protein